MNQAQNIGSLELQAAKEMSCDQELNEKKQLSTVPGTHKVLNKCSLLYYFYYHYYYPKVIVCGHISGNLGDPSVKMVRAVCWSWLIGAHKSLF